MGYQHIMRWNGLKFTSDILEVTTDEVLLNSGTFIDVTIPAVTMNKCLLVYSFDCDRGTANQSQTRVSGQITSSTNLRFEVFSSSTNPKNIRWYLIEFSTLSPAIVQRGTHVAITNDDNVTISSVNLSNAFPYTSTRCEGSQAGSRAMVRSIITDTTTLNLRSNAGPDATTEWQVLNHPNWNVSTATATRTGASATVDTTVPAMVLTDTWIIGSFFFSSPTSQAKDWSIYYPTSTTNIRGETGDNSGTTEIQYYIINGNGNFEVQASENTMTAGTDINNTSISAINQANSIAFAAYGAQSQGIDLNSSPVSSDPNDTYAQVELTSNTNVKTERVGSAVTPSTNKVALQAIDFSNSI